MLRALRYTICFDFLRKSRSAFARSLQPLAYEEREFVAAYASRAVDYPLGA